MKIVNWRRGWAALLCGAWLFTVGAHGQIVTDGTLGPATTLAGPNFKIPDTLGKTVGHNLFHSFQRFGLEQGQSATFSGPDHIANVMSRVTGGQVSILDGALNCTIPGANLFLVNPAGVVLGPHASVDVGGSFAVSTADYLALADGGRFDAQSPARDTLTVAPPAAFGFLAPSAGKPIAGVTFNGSQIRVSKGNGLTVAAGEVVAKRDDVSGGSGQAAKLEVSGGTLQLAAVASEGQIPLADLATDSFSALGDLALSGGSVLSVEAEASGGRLLLRGNDLTMRDGSAVINTARGIGVGRESVVAMAGKVSLSGGAKLSSESYDQANAGDIVLKAKNLRLEGGSEITSVSNEAGDSGSIRLAIENGITLDGTSQANYIATLAAMQSAGGRSGDLEVHAGSIQIQGENVMYSAVAGTGQGGRVTVTAAEGLEINGQGKNASIFVGSLNTGEGGPSGDMTVKAKTIQVANGGNLLASTMGAGKAGSISVTATEDLVLDGQGQAALIGTISNEGARGDSGNIEVQAKRVRVMDGGGISTSAMALGKSGNVRVTAEESIVLSGKNTPAFINASSLSSGAGGDAGDVEVAANKIEVLEGGGIVSATVGLGGAGTVRVQGADIMVVGGAKKALISSDSKNEGQGGSAGNVEVRAATLKVANNAYLSSSSKGFGKAGSVTVQVDGDLLVDGQGAGAFISANSSNPGSGGDAGDIEVAANTVRVLNEGQIVSVTAGQGKGGKVSVSAGDSVLVDGRGHSAYLMANSESEGTGGDAGTINIQAGEIRVVDGGRVGSSSWGTGNGGDVSLTAGRDLIVGGAGDLAFIEADSRHPELGGHAGSIVARAGQVQILSDGYIVSRTYGLGNAGSIKVTADQDLTVDGRGVGAFINAGSIREGPGGNAGDIEIAANTVQVVDGGQIMSLTAGLGKGGAVRIAATEQVTVGGKGGNAFIAADSNSSGPGGNAGDVEVRAGGVQVLKSGYIVSRTRGLGNAGSLRLHADNEVTVDGSGWGAFVSANSLNPGPGGNAGDVEVDADTIQVLNEGRIVSATSGQGEGGKVGVRADNAILVDGQGGNAYIMANSESAEKGGDAGTIRLQGGEIKVVDGGDVGSSSSGTGKGGTVSLVAGHGLTVGGAGGLAFVEADSRNEGLGGNAGDIVAQAGQVRVLRAYP